MIAAVKLTGGGLVTRASQGRERNQTAMFTITKTSAFWMMTACALAGCVAPDETISDETISDEAIEDVGQGLAAYDAPGGAAYAMTNQQGNNEVVVYKRAQNGTLVLSGVVPTGGGGSGVQLDPVDSLGSQGSLVLDRKHRYLFAVNTETVSSDNDCHQGSISVFRIAADGALTGADRRFRSIPAPAGSRGAPSRPACGSPAPPWPARPSGPSCSATALPCR